ncbi:LacI family DNA-binding transcriptional regulator [Sanguibacter antarcticus]|uniref:LacI family transcriptional regulator n=1 Tax=Sanguibacter antarcticus TaxID=372484 RepID=A0A2A9E1A2_9MICO|nr:substrate-binding domain-containing protein [Sanguibacter antarcticus]PFG32634.1 LacI family transcriptional regulator [Sanguibacter antarcticus]
MSSDAPTGLPAPPSPSHGAVGMVRTASRRVVTVEPFFMEFIAGVEEVLAVHDLSVLLAVVADEDAERRTYERWARSRLVDAVMVVNVRDDDDRPALLAAHGIPTVMVGRWDDEPSLPSVRADDLAAMNEAAGYLLELGHRTLAHVTGPSVYLHTQARVRALTQVCASYGVVPVTVEGDYSDDAGERITRELLERSPRPTAIVFDNDVMAVAGLHVAHELGIAVPGELSLLGWDDSPLCRLTQPPLSTMSLDVHEMGRLVGGAVLETIEGSAQVKGSVVTARLIVRGSTAAPLPA